MTFGDPKMSSGSPPESPSSNPVAPRSPTQAKNCKPPEREHHFRSPPVLLYTSSPRAPRHPFTAM